MTTGTKGTPPRPDKGGEAATAKPGRPRSAQAEKAIIEAALDLLTTHGVDGVRMEEVAARAGVAKTTVYRRWPDKLALIVDAIAHLRGPLPNPKGDNVREDLIYLVRSMRKGHNDRVGLLMHKLWSSAGDHPGLLENCRQRLGAPRRALLHKVIQRGITEGSIRQDIDLTIAGELLLGPIFTANFTRGHRYTDDEVTTLVDMVLRSLAPAP